jgi:hypothetical protein
MLLRNNCQGWAYGIIVNIVRYKGEVLTQALGAATATATAAAAAACAGMLLMTAASHMSPP